MRPQTIMPCAVGLAILLLLAPPALSQGLDEHLLMLQPLVGKAWIGHYMGSSESELEHTIRWDPVLAGKVVKSTKQVAELDFRMETLYFWDWEAEAVSFLQLTNRGLLSRGIVSFEGGKVTLLGMGIRPTGVSEFKQAFAIRGGTLEDYFYRKEDSSGKQGHLIKYERSGWQIKEKAVRRLRYSSQSRSLSAYLT